MTSLEGVILESIKGLSSEDDGVRSDAEKSLFKHIKTESGMEALIADWYKTFAPIIEGAESGLAATCMSRMWHYRVTGTLGDWGLQSLKSYLTKFDRKSQEDREKMLRAVQYFAAVCPENASKVEKSGWVNKVLSCSCRKEDRGPAVLLLEALERLPGLPELIHGAPNSEDMLKHVIRKGEEHEQLAGLRVTLRVVLHLEQVPPAAAAAWLAKLHTEDMIPAVVKCMKKAKGSGAVGSAVDLLAQLSKHEMFLEELQKEEVLRDLVDLMVGKRRFGTSLSVLLPWILTSEEAANRFTAAGGCNRCLQMLARASLENSVARDIVSGVSLWLARATSPEAANAFTSAGGPKTFLEVLARASLESDVARDMISVLSLWLARATGPEAANAFTSAGGLKTCLGLLHRADPEAVKGILDLLEAWSVECTNPRLAFEQRPDLARLLALVGEEDKAIAAPACVLVSWALHPGSRERPYLAQKLKHEAITTLFPFVDGATADAKCVLEKVHCFVKEYVRDTESADRLAAFGVFDRLLMVLSGDPSVDTLKAGLLCLQELVNHNTRFLADLDRMGSVGILLACLIEQEVHGEDVDLNTGILWLVNSILCDTRESRGVMEADISSVTRLLKVSKQWPSARQWLPFQAVRTLIAESRTWKGLGASSKEMCMQLCVAMLRDQLKYPATMAALGVLARFLEEASTSQGQAFITAGGPERLVHYLKSDDADRNLARFAVLVIASNGHLADVLAKVEEHASVAAARLVEMYPPHDIDGAVLLEEIKAAFYRLPQWPLPGGTSEEAPL